MDFIEALQVRWTEEAKQLERRGLKGEGAFLWSITDDLGDAESRWLEGPVRAEGVR